MYGIFVLFIIIIVVVIIIIQISKMHDTEEPVVVAVRVRPLSSEESEKNAVSIAQLLPHEPKVSSLLTNIVSKTWLDTVSKQLYHISV
jgi:hypothetical protein